MAQMSQENNTKKPTAAPKLPPRPLPPRPPARPAPTAAGQVQRPVTPVQKPITPTKPVAVENKNLNVVEKALSVEEMNAQKQRRIRKGTYAMSAIFLVLIVALALAIFWPVKNAAAAYDYTFNEIPSKAQVVHVMKSGEVSGSTVIFKEPIKVELSDDVTKMAAFIVKPTFICDGEDITEDISLLLVYENSEDVLNLDADEAIVGTNRIYLDLAENEYIYFTKVLSANDAAYPLIVGFSPKDQNKLKKEITMTVEIYAFNAESLELINQTDGKIYAKIGSDVEVLTSQEWVNKVQANATQKKN